MVNLVSHKYVKDQSLQQTGYTLSKEKNFIMRDTVDVMLNCVFRAPTSVLTIEM
jgi:hypothetical protein